MSRSVKLTTDLFLKDISSIVVLPSIWTFQLCANFGHFSDSTRERSESKRRYHGIKHLTNRQTYTQTHTHTPSRPIFFCHPVITPSFPRSRLHAHFYSNHAFRPKKRPTTPSRHLLGGGLCKNCSSEFEVFWGQV